MRAAAALVVCVLFTAPAFAQTYVAGAVGMDIFRSQQVDGAVVNDASTSGEAVNFSLRAGTALGSRWGVELGFTRPAAIESESDGGVFYPLLSERAGGRLVALPPGVDVPVFESRIRYERTNTTVDAVAWASQPVSASVDLVFLGGVAFNRVVEEVEFEFGRRAAAIGILPESTETTSYGVGPVVGFEARILLTDHVLLSPGVRLQGVGGQGTSAWLVRPSVGIGWRF